MAALVAALPLPDVAPFVTDEEAMADDEGAVDPEPPSRLSMLAVAVACTCAEMSA
jgi:hypothetical protein